MGFKWCFHISIFDCPCLRRFCGKPRHGEIYFYYQTTDYDFKTQFLAYHYLLKNLQRFSFCPKIMSSILNMAHKVKELLMYHLPVPTGIFMIQFWKPFPEYTLAIRSALFLSSVRLMTPQTSTSMSSFP